MFKTISKKPSPPPPKKNKKSGGCLLSLRSGERRGVRRGGGGGCSGQISPSKPCAIIEMAHLAAGRLWGRFFFSLSPSSSSSSSSLQQHACMSADVIWFLMACRKFGVTTPDIKAREGGRERKREREREREGGGRERERHWEREKITAWKILVQGYLSSFSTYFSYWDFYQQVTAPSLRVARVKDGWQLAGL